MSRLVVLHEPGRRARDVLRAAAERARSAHATLTVAVRVPPQVRGCCSVGRSAWDRVMQEEAERDLAEAVRQLGRDAPGTELRLLVEDRGPSFPDWVADEGFDEVLLPAHPPLHRHPLASRLRRRAHVPVQLV